MKTMIPAGAVAIFLALAGGVAGYAQQIETYDSGTYSDIFQTNPPAVFSFANGQGLNATRGVQPLNVQYSLNFLRKGPFSLSGANSTMEISTFFKVTKPTSASLGIDALQLGFAQNQTASSFISAGQTGAVSWWLYANATTNVGNGFRFETTIHVDVYNGSSSAGFGWGNGELPILKSNNWYKATFQVSRVNSTTLNMVGRIDDYGTNGQTYISNVAYLDTGNATGSAQYPFTPFTTDSTMYPAIHGMSNGGLKIADNTACSGTFSPAIATDIYLVVQLDFATQIGKNYYISASPDLNQWTAIEGPIPGNGNVLTRYYSTSSTKRFFRVVEDSP
jgi:hypothetical protein